MVLGTFKNTDMKLEVKTEQIVSLINDNYPNGDTAELLFEMIDKCTHTWDEYRKLTIKMLKNIDRNGELTGVIESIK